jgi:hypothetical protein
MTEVADFVIITGNDHGNFGKWTSRKFSAGGRHRLVEAGEELNNAYLTFRLFVGDNEPDRHIRVIINTKPLGQFLRTEGNETTTIVSFPASMLIDGDGNENVVELHSQGETPFLVGEAIVHFRQNA